MCFTVHEHEKYKQQVLLIVVGAIGSLLFKKDFLQTVGALFIMLLAVDTVSTVLSTTLIPIMYKRVSIKSVSEIHMAPKRYQYVIDLGYKTIYSYIYTRPLETVNITCWSMGGRDMLWVRSKKKDERKEKDI